MDESPDPEEPSPTDLVESALIEVHHLTNLTGLDEAKMARRRLVDAQSAARSAKTRDLLLEASEYLELARMERRDAAAGFEEAGQYAQEAALRLGDEDAVPVEEPVGEMLLADPERGRRTLAEFHREESVGSYARLRHDTGLELAFARIRSEADDGVIDDPHAVTDDDEDAPESVEAALSAASLEVDIERAIQNASQSRADSEFQFLSADQLAAVDSE